MVRAEYGRELDFSEPTIGAVEVLLNGFWKEADSSRALFTQIALLFGSYIGELIRTRYPQASWVGGSMTPDAPPPLVRLGDIDVSPVVWCFKRLHNGPADSVVDKYPAFRQAAAERGHSAEPGAAADGGGVSCSRLSAVSGNVMAGQGRPGPLSLGIRRLCTMSRASFVTTLDPPWTRMEPVRLGRVPTVHGTPDRFLVVESGERPLLRVDLHQSNDECFAFEEACLWSGFVVIGWGHRVYLVDLRTRAVSSHNLDCYFGHLYPAEQYLLIASAEGLCRIDPDGSLLWRIDALGIDGAVVDQVAGDVIRGQGEWDPPGGWRPFEVSLSTGERL